MLNQVILVGRLAREVETKELEGGKKKAYITLACPRSYKNADGEYDTDFIDCVLWEGIATNAAEYCNKGDIVGIKGRIQNEVVIDTDLQKVYDMVRNLVKDSDDEEEQEKKIQLLTDISSLMAKRKPTIKVEKLTFLSSSKKSSEEDF